MKSSDAITEAHFKSILCIDQKAGGQNQFAEVSEKGSLTVMRADWGINSKGTCTQETAQKIVTLND